MDPAHTAASTTASWPGGGPRTARPRFLVYQCFRLPVVSSLWTPDGERPVGRPAEAGGRRGARRAGGAAPGRRPRRAGRRPTMDEEELAEQVAAMRAELANSPVEVVVANHCYGLFELAAVYLSQQPPLLSQARLAIDALGSLVDRARGSAGRGRGAAEGRSQPAPAGLRADRRGPAGRGRGGLGAPGSTAESTGEDRPAPPAPADAETGTTTATGERGHRGADPARAVAGSRADRAARGPAPTPRPAGPRSRTADRPAVRRPASTPPGSAASSGCPSAWSARGPTWPCRGC